LGGLASSFFSSFSGNKRQQQQQQQHRPPDSESSGGMLVVAVLLLLAYGVYKLFLSGDTVQLGQGAGQTGYPQHNHPNNMGAPHPPGFKPDYTGANPGYGFRGDYTHGQHYQGGGTGPGTGGGFWTGMGTGGMLGYLFGRQRLVNRVAHLQLEKTTLQGHAKLQVSVEPKEDRSWKGGKVLFSRSQEQLSVFLSGSRTRVS
ncbi:hypothetical protein GOODEAATRI_008369, partial [Goodea atripinnis]